MTDPYEVLGVGRNASEEEIKSAYKQLAKKYHSDNYVNNPLSDLAEEKMKEINVAYDTIMRDRKSNGGAGNAYSNMNQGGYSGASQSNFADIRNLITRGKIAEAEELLGGIPNDRRDAEWNFLKGTVYYQRGWLEEAANSFRTAVSMNPNNPEYRAALNNMMYRQAGQMNGYPGNGYHTTNVNGCGLCDMCSGMVCADCFCESCCGMDLISCC